MFDFSDFGDVAAMGGVLQRNEMTQQMRAGDAAAQQRADQAHQDAQEQKKIQMQQLAAQQQMRDDQKADLDRIRIQQEKAVDARKSIVNVSAMLDQLKLKYGDSLA